MNRKGPWPPSTHGETLAAALADLLSRAALQRQTWRTPAGQTVLPAFVDDAEAAGLRFVQNNGHSDAKNPPPPETMCGGVACSITTATAGSTSTWSREGRSRPRRSPRADGDRLFRNRGDGTFEDVTVRLGDRRPADAATGMA